jgi:flagellar export protein FliJ
MTPRFRLAGVLRLRERLADERAFGLAAAVRQRDAHAAHLAELRAQRAAAGRALLAAGFDGATAAAVRTLAATAEHARRTAGLAAARLAAAEAGVEAARVELVRAVQDRRVLELLRDNQRAAWQEDERRDEQRRLDDLAGVYHLHRGSATGKEA